jgi:flagellar export protein FliJ
MAALTRLSRLSLDEKRLKLLALQADRDKLAAASARLLTEIDAERKAAAASMEGSWGFSSFLENARLRLLALGRDLDELDSLCIAAREGGLAAFSEVKTHETVRENHRARERAEEKSRERGETDELALEVFRRGKSRN